MASKARAAWEWRWGIVRIIISMVAAVMAVFAFSRGDWIGGVLLAAVALSWPVLLGSFAAAVWLRTRREQ
jgi:hypothetical protein